MYVLDANDGVTVIACFHGSRDPMRWEQRTVPPGKVVPRPQ
jgi:hypothetical protein